MPGPSSDSYDPEFGTRANAEEVRDALATVVKRLNGMIGTEPHYILDVVRRKNTPREPRQFSERELRLLRFALNRELESI